MSRRTWSDQEILDAMVAWAEKLGRNPRWKDWEFTGEDHPSSMTVWTRCGSWEDALVMAGLPLDSPQRRKATKEPSFSMKEARAMRKRGMSNNQIAKELGVSASAIGRGLGPRPVERKPRNAVEAREFRIAALKKALGKEAQNADA